MVIIKDLDFLYKLAKKNIHFKLSWDGNDFSLTLCKPRWITNKRGQSILLPFYSHAKFISKVLNAAVKDGWLKG